MKKRIVCFLLSLLLLTMAACGNQSAEPAPAETVAETAAVPETTAAPTEPVEETTVPAPVEPEWEPGISRAGYGEAVYRVFDIGTELKVVGKFRSYYVVEQEDVNLLVHQSMLRLREEPAFEIWDGFSLFSTEVFEDPYFRGEPIAVLRQNTPITILDSKGGWAYIEWSAGEGYVKVEKVSKWPVSNGGSSGGSGGGGGKAPSDGTDVPIGSLTSAESGSLPQIRLLGAYYGPETEKLFEQTTATVLAPNTEGYICILVRGDEVRVTGISETTATIWLGDEIYAKVPRWLVTMEEDAVYESWTGYSAWNGIVYEEYQMRTELMTLKTNQQVTVLDELEGCYVVEVDGQIGYMVPEKISVYRHNSGGSSSGGTGSGAAWTPPTL